MFTPPHQYLDDPPKEKFPQQNNFRSQKRFLIYIFFFFCRLFRTINFSHRKLFKKRFSQLDEKKMRIKENRLRIDFLHRLTSLFLFFYFILWFLYIFHVYSWSSLAHHFHNFKDFLCWKEKQKLIFLWLHGKNENIFFLKFQ